MKEYYIIGTGKDFVKAMWQECLQLPNVHYYDEFYYRKRSTNFIIRNIKRFQFSYRVRCKWLHTMKRVWRREYTIGGGNIFSD